jgi:hypothetical protein
MGLISQPEAFAGHIDDDGAQVLGIANIDPHPPVGLAGSVLRILVSASKSVLIKLRVLADT